MGITARGAWEAVQAPFPRDGRRHHRRRRSPSSASATCRATCSATACCCRAHDQAGRRLRSPRHLHRSRLPIRQRSFAERQRLFDLPRSSWQDYDKALISPGRRHLLAHGQGDRARRRRRRRCSASTRPRPRRSEVMTRDPQGARSICSGSAASAPTSAPRRETDDAGRRPRQRSRSASPAPTLRAKVVGEGANLGMTQRGRIEAAQRGVRLNTDAIDNSAGVNTSDVEVNIKIALSAAGARRAARRSTARNTLLAEMTDEVGRARAAQQLSADAGALARRAARAARISASSSG